tara:strand:+ start:737 stop:2329 length:1593 start_codon:yes stop_codon:yes gene_type:complete
MDESLHQLAASGNLRYIKKALETPNLFYSTDDDNGWTPLHYASNKSKVKIVSVILEAGVDPNIQSKPVSIKQSNWNLAIINDEECQIVTPMDVADGPNRHKIIGSLKDAGGTFYNEELTLHQCVQLEDIDEIEGLLEDDSLKINARDHRGWMALHYAVDINNINIVKLLLDAKANINGSTFNKNDLFHFNAWEIANANSSNVMLEYLVKRGACKHPGRGNPQYKPKVNNQVVDTSAADEALERIRKERRAQDEDRKALQEPDTLLGKLFEPKEKKEKRQAVKNRIANEQAKARKEAAEKIKKEEEAKKEERVIKWQWGRDPFKLRGEGIEYDTPCRAHTYFMDIVGYSKKTTGEQKKCTDELIDYVKSTQDYKKADRQGKLIILPTGDGMALVFFNSVTAAFKCMVDVGRLTYKHSSIGLRNGLYSGPVVPVKDINDNPNVSGTGINMAQRCMDAGDNDHLLISNDVHQYVCEMDIPGLQFDDWGPVVVKHGTTIHMWTAYGNRFGRREFPSWRGTKKAEFKTLDNEDEE